MGRNRWEKPYKYIAEEEIRRYRRKTGQKTGKKKKESLSKMGRKLEHLHSFQIRKAKNYSVV